MNKLKTTLGAYGLSAVLLLVGCADKGTLDQSTEGGDKSDHISEKTESTNSNAEIGLMPITEVRATFDEQTNKIKSQTFDNISFADAYFTFPQADKVHIFEYNITDFDISPDDAYDYMCKRLDELFPKMFSDEEKAEEIRFFDVRKIDEYPTLEQYKALEEKDYPYILSNHPTTGIDHTSDKCNECYLYVLNGILWMYDNGSLAKKCGFDRGLGSFDVLNEFPVVYRTENLESDRIFHLASGDISVAEAVKSAEKQLFKLELSKRDIPLKLRIQNVNVVDIGNNCYAFYFGIVPEYKNMKYNCILPDDTVWGFGTIDDTTHEREACGEAIMCETDKLCRFRLLNPASVYDIVECSSSTSILPIKNAAEITSKYLTAGTSFNVLSVSSVYKPFSEIEYNQSIDYESYEKRKITIRPCWRFVLQPLTGNTDRLYYIFVDMLTGEPYRTVQQMGSDVEYD